jgi:hypothetical protein
MLRVERRRKGRQFLSNRYYVRTTPAPAACATVGGGRPTQRLPPTPGASPTSTSSPGAAWRRAQPSDSPRGAGHRKCLLLAIRMAVVNRGWPAEHVQTALNPGAVHSQ